MDRPLKVAVIDDHPMYLKGVTGLLASVPDINLVGIAETGEEAVLVAAQHRPDVVLIDLNLPRISGAEATAQVLRASPQTAVLVLTMLDDDSSVVAALRAGARGYVLKGAGQQELIAAVRTVADGGAVFSGPVAERVLETLTAPAPRAAPKVRGLSTREAEVLQLMARGLENPRIAADLGITEMAVQNHVTKVLTKLQACERADAVLRSDDDE